MKATQTDTGVLLSLTAEEAHALEEELLWISEGNPSAIQVWEALNELRSEGQAAGTSTPS